MAIEVREASGALHQLAQRPHGDGSAAKWRLREQFLDEVVGFRQLRTVGAEEEDSQDEDSDPSSMDDLHG